VALPLELEKIEETVMVYKQVCSTVHKKLCEYLPSAGKGTDGQSIERRLKKTPDFLLGQSLSEQGRTLAKSSSTSCLGQVLLEAGGVCTTVGHDLVQYEIQVEHIIQQLDIITKTELPAIVKARRGLDQLVLELDTAKARLAAAKLEAEQAGVISGGGKVDKCGEELDDAERKVEMARDSLATDMMTFLARDVELAGMVGKFLDHKLEYHQSLTEQVRYTQPKIDSILESKRGYPLFGCSLSTHLSTFNLPSGLAWPLQACVSRLVSLGLEEEGLFRLAAGNGKVRRLRAELETAGLHPVPSLETADHHLLTATIKAYLRELPEPLFGADLYPQWLEAGKLDDTSERFDAVWNLLQDENLPRENYRNIQYLFRLLHEVSKYEERNKMSPSNLAIVITPNVIWDDAVHDTLDISTGSCLARVVEQIISQYQWFFQNDGSQPWDHLLPSSSLTVTNSLPQPAVPSLPSTLNSSPVPNTRERKGKGKKAPPPPGESLSPPNSSPSHARLSGDNFQPEKVTNLHRKTNSMDGVESNTNLYPALSDSFPVPAPRNIKPVVPSKPEGISRYSNN